MGKMMLLMMMRCNILQIIIIYSGELCRGWYRMRDELNEGHVEQVKSGPDDKVGSCLTAPPSTSIQC